MQPLWVLVVLFAFSRVSATSIFTTNSSERNKIIAQTLVRIVKDFYVKKSGTLDITVAYLDRKEMLSQCEILNRVLYQTHDAIATRIENIATIKPSIPRMFNVFLVDGLQSFEVVLRAVNDKIYSLGGYFLIVLATEKVDLQPTLQIIFQRLFDRYIINANVIFVPDNYSGNIYTFFPFTRHHCHQVVPVLYNSFQSGNLLRNVETFPNKLGNFFGCSINVVTWQFPPHVYLRRQDNGTIIPGGIDGNILNILQAEFNFSINFMVPTKRDDRGTIYPNGTATGAHKMILDGDGNLTICGYGYTYYRSTVLSASTNYYYSSFVIVKPGQISYTAFERLFFPFDYIVWWCIALIFSIGFVTTGTLKLLDVKWHEYLAGHGNHSPILQMFNTFIGGAVTVVPRRNFGRTILIIWMLANIVIRSSYQGLLFKFLQQDQFKKSPQNLQVLLDNGYRIYSPKSFVSIFDSLQIPKDKYDNIELPIEPYFERTQEARYKRTLITTHFQVNMYNSQNWSRIPLDILRERLFLLPMVILYKKNSYLREPFDTTLHKLIGSGLISQWASLDMNRTATSQESKNAITKAITLHDFSGCYILCAILLVMAFALFTCEILSPKYVTLRKLIEFYTY